MSLADNAEGSVIAADSAAATTVGEILRNAMDQAEHATAIPGGAKLRHRRGSHVMMEQKLLKP